MTAATTLEPAFQLDCVEKADAPDGTVGTDWYRFTVCDRDQTITAYWRGSRTQVDARADNFIERLNATR